MGTSEGCHDEWNDLLVSGDAVGLIAVFSEAAASTSSADNCTLKSIFTFLESRLFVSALSVDLPRLWSSASREYMESVLNETSPHTVDPREILTELLSVGQLTYEYAVAVYFRLLRAVLRQVLLDTLRRKKGCISFEDQLSQSQTIMRAWYGGIEERVSHVIQRFCRRDALPEMIRTVNKFQQNDVESGNDEEESDDTDCSISMVESGTLEALVKLSVDLVIMIGNPEKTVPLLLMVKAITVASQPYNDGERFLRKLGTELKQWANMFSRVGDVKTGPHTHSSLTEKLSPAEIPRDHVEMTELLTQTLLDIVPSSELCSSLLKYTDTWFPKDFVDSITYEDNERGKDASDTKTFASLHELKKEKNELCVLTDDEEDDEEDSEISLGAVSLRKVGAMLILYDAMTVEKSSSFCCALISNSPTTLLFLSCPMVLECLKSASLNAVMSGLSFLVMFLPHVPPYSVLAPGELKAKAAQIHEHGQKQAGSGGAFCFRTRRFELMFELVKSLVNISATCPSEDHREVARAVFMLLLQRFAADLRMLMYSSFLVVTPFASICSLMLHSLRTEWSSSQLFSSGSEFDFLRRSLPRCLLQAQKNWLRKLRIGEVTFVDPMIQSFNFVRFVIAEDRRRDPMKAFFRLDAGEKVQLCKKNSEEDECDNWEKYLGWLLINIVPSLRDTVKNVSDASLTSRSVLHSARFSPLDCFALTTSLDGLEEQVVYTAVLMIRTDLVPADEFATIGESTRITPVQERRSSAYLTKYEVARVLGERARQIVNGTSVFLHNRGPYSERSALELAERCSDPYSMLVDPIFIAKMDLLQGKIPMIVRRTWPDGRTENIPVSELLIDKAMLNLQS